MSSCPPPTQLSPLELLGLGDCGWGATLLWGLENSVIIAIGAYALGFSIGIGGAFGKLYGGPILKDLLATYTTIVRAVPELVLILFLFYAFTGLLNQALLSWGYPRVQISPIIEVDHRPVGSGAIGPITQLLHDRYFDAVRGRLPAYEHWLTPIV